MLDKFNGGKSKNIFNIVTGDESWIYQYDPEMKRKSLLWVYSGEDPPTKVRKSRSVGKKMICCFFSTSVHIVTVNSGPLV